MPPMRCELLKYIDIELSFPWIGNTGQAIGNVHQYMLRLLYSLILFFLLPLLVLRLLVKSFGVSGYRNRIGERFGAIADPQWNNGKSKVWVHAVSVGEVVASAPIVKELLRQNLNVVVTTTTPTGSDRVRALFGQDVFHVYVPYDLSFLVRRFINKVKPDLLLIMETELWPNLLHQCRHAGVKVVLANARLSAKSAAGYQRFSKLTHTMLSNIDQIAAQANADAERFIQLGADTDAVTTTGSLKFYVDVDNKETLGGIFTSIKHSGRAVLIAASTREGEEEKVLAAYQNIKKDNERTLLLLIPRHPERFDKVENMVKAAGFVIQRRSIDETLETETDVVLGDSMGEMLAYYQLADIAFVGGSLVDTGCQNVIEPAAIGLPVIVGPSQFNFATICEQLESAGALQTVQDSDSLASAVNKLLADESTRQAMGAAGKNLVSENQRALPMLMDIIKSVLDN